MDIIKIGYNSFKIALSATEAMEYDFTSNDSCNDQQVKNSLKLLFEKMKATNKIEIESDKVSAEIYISKDGGCEIFVSRVNAPKQGRRQSKTEPISIYCFSRIDELLRACYRAYVCGLNSSSDAYHDSENGNYYLILNEIYPKDLKCAFLTEYGERVKNNMLFYLKEHCDCICSENAVEIFAKLL